MQVVAASAFVGRQTCATGSAADPSVWQVYKGFVVQTRAPQTTASDAGRAGRDAAEVTDVETARAGLVAPFRRRAVGTATALNAAASVGQRRVLIAEAERAARKSAVAVGEKPFGVAVVIAASAAA